MQAGIQFSERDFFKTPFSGEEILGLAGRSSISDLFSWRSPTIKKLGLNPTELDDAGLTELMLKEPRLIRRPLIKVADKLIIGANPKDLAAAFQQS